MTSQTEAGQNGRKVSRRTAEGKNIKIKGYKRAKATVSNSNSIIIIIESNKMR